MSFFVYCFCMLKEDETEDFFMAQRKRSPRVLHRTDKLYCCTRARSSLHGSWGRLGGKSGRSVKQDACGGTDKNMIQQDTMPQPETDDWLRDGRVKVEESRVLTGPC